MDPSKFLELWSVGVVATVSLGRLTLGGSHKKNL